MWLQYLTTYLLQHRWRALLLTFLLSFVPIIGIVGILFAALVTLIKGIRESIPFMLAATLPYLITFLITTKDFSGSIMVWAAIGVAVLSNVLTWVFAILLYRKATWSQILQVAALLGVLTVSVIHLAYPNIVDLWATELQSYLNQVTATLKTAVVPTDTEVEAINVTKYYATGLIVAAILFNAILQLIVGRWWQSIVFQPGLLRKELYNIRLNQLAGILFILSLILSYIGNSVVLDIMPILYLLFGVAGLSLVHYFFGLMNSQTSWVWLSIFYIAFIISMPVSIMLVGLFALVDIWFDARKRFKSI